MNIYLQIFLLVNVFLIGVILTIAVRHAREHFRPHEEEKPKTPEQPTVRITTEMRDQLILEAKEKFELALDHSVVELQHDIANTALKINTHLEKLGTTIVADELERFRTLLEELKDKTESTVLGGQTQLADHQAQLNAQLEERHKELEAKAIEEVTAEKQRVLQQIDTKLSDAVASFLLETLQHNVDLGAQSEYMIAMLEEHKADFAKRVTDEV
jgi:hypothetical protein